VRESQQEIERQVNESTNRSRARWTDAEQRKEAITNRLVALMVVAAFTFAIVRLIVG
jgi:hypothetical protein